MVKDGISVKGNITIAVYNENMELKETHCFKNLITNIGKNYIAKRMTSNSEAIMTHMALGLSATAAAITDTALGNEAGRVALEIPSVVSANVIQYVATFPAGVATGDLKEAGIFNHPSSGDMLNRASINITKSSSDTIVVSWNLAIQ